MGPNRSRGTWEHFFVLFHFWSHFLFSFGLFWKLSLEREHFWELLIFLRPFLVCFGSFWSKSVCSGLFWKLQLERGVFWVLLLFLRPFSVHFETNLFVSVVSKYIRNTKTNRNKIFIGFKNEPKQTRNRSCFGYFRFEPKFFYSFRGHPSYRTYKSLKYQQLITKSCSFCMHS